MRYTAADMERALKAYENVLYSFNPEISPKERHALAVQAALDALEPVKAPGSLAQWVLLGGITVLFVFALTGVLRHLMF